MLKRDANPQVVLNQLFKFTKLQDSLSINMLAIKDGRPKTMGLKEILDQYIIFQKKIVTRRTQFDLKKAEARMHILEGLRIALNNIDEIINIIRNSYDDAKERLMETFSLSEIQAQSVLDMRLAQLQKLNGEKIDEPYISKKAYGEANVTFPYTVSAGKVFVMGDERTGSIDSRNTEIGCISQEQIIGKVVIQLWPFKKIAIIK